MVFQRAIIAVIFTASPVFVAAATFSAYTLQGSELTAEIAFTSVGMKGGDGEEQSKLIFISNLRNTSTATCRVAKRADQLHRNESVN